MPRLSQISTHPSRDAIEAQLLNGTPVVQVAARYRVSASSLYRYQSNMTSNLRDALHASETASATTFLARIEELANDAQEARRALRDAGQLAAATRAAEHELKTLTVLMDRLGIDSTDTLERLTQGDNLAKAVAALVRTSLPAAKLFQIGLRDLDSELAEDLLSLITNIEKREIA